MSHDTSEDIIDVESFEAEQSSSQNNSAVPQKSRLRRVRRCRICKRFMDYEVLKIHMRKYHDMEITEEVKILRPKKKRPRCEVEGCGYVARTESAYLKHMKDKHPVNIENKSDSLIRCPLCQTWFTLHEDLVEHCRTVHDDPDCVVEMRTFQNAKECEKWKDSLAESHCTAWLICEGYWSTAHNTLYYQCSRCEPGTSSVINPPYCTSFLKEFIYEDGAILVKYCTRHLNHNLSTRDLPLSNTDKNIVAGYLRMGLDVDVIRDRLREEYTDPRSRLHWISTAEICDISANLQYESKLNEKIATSSENSSVDQALINPTFDDNPISATALLEESSKCVDDRAEPNDDVVDASTTNPAVSAESLLGCSSCAVLAEKVAELEALVKKLSEKVMEVHGPQVLDNGVKVEES
nr:Hypothetical protein CBG22545 [Haemonchus contortus]